MAIISVDKKELKKIFGSLSDEKIEHLLGMFGTAVEKISEENIEVEIAPNRPDMLSQQGLFRALRTYSGKSARKYKVNPPGKNYIIRIDSSVKKVRPFTTCAIVKNLKFDDEKIKEIIDIQEKLHMTIGRNRRKVAIGIYPLEKITLPITYKAESPEKIKFTPLEMKEEMNGKQILSRHPAGKDYAHLLEGQEKYPIFHDSKNEILSMPPIINSQLTGKITEKTKEVFIECSGHELEILNKTLNIIVCALADLGGEIYGMKLAPGKVTPNLEPEKIKISLEDANKLLGLDLKEKEVKKLLEKMGCSYNKSVVEYPAYRTDILHAWDIYEDIAIAYGYDKFLPEIPEISTIGQESQIETKKRKIAEILNGLNLLEISTYHLTNKQDIKKTSLKLQKIEVIDSKTDYNILRPSLLVPSLKVLSENIDAKYPQKIYELGKVFEMHEGDILEKEKLLIALSGETNFTELKQILDYLMRMLNREYKIEETEHPSLISGRVGKILAGGKEIGILGEISPNVLKNWHLKMPVVALEMEIEIEEF